MQASLITCTHNSEKTIKDCCLSILAQTYGDIEHIVLDKNSQDETIDIVKQSNIGNQKIIQQKSSGIYGALNEGMRAATGDVIGILHSDDQLLDKNIIKTISEIFLKEKVDILFSNLVYTSGHDTNKIIRRWTTKLDEGYQSNNLILQKIYNGWMPPHPTLFIRKSFIKKNQIFYDESYKISSDYDFIIRLFSIANTRIFFLNKFTIKMRFGGESNKNIKNLTIKMKEDFQILKKNKLNPFKLLLLKNFSKISQFF